MAKFTWLRVFDVFASGNVGNRLFAEGSFLDVAIGGAFGQSFLRIGSKTRGQAAVEAFGFS